MPPIATPPDPTWAWMTINPDGSMSIDDPPSPGNQLRNDNLVRLNKHRLFAAVPCTNQSFRLFRCLMSGTQSEAETQLSNLQGNPQQSFPFHTSAVALMGKPAVIKDEGPLKDCIKGRSTPKGTLDLIAIVTSGSEFGVSFSTCFEHCLLQSCFLPPREPGDKYIVVAVCPSLSGH